MTRRARLWFHDRFTSRRCLRTWGRREDGNCPAFCHERRPWCGCGCHGMEDQ